MQCNAATFGTRSDIVSVDVPSGMSTDGVTETYQDLALDEKK